MYIQNLTRDMESIKTSLIKLPKMKTAKPEIKKNTLDGSIRSEKMVNLKKNQQKLINETNRKKYNFIYVSFLLLFKHSVGYIVYIKVK